MENHGRKWSNGVQKGLDGLEPKPRALWPGARFAFTNSGDSPRPRSPPLYWFPATHWKFIKDVRPLLVFLDPLVLARKLPGFSPESNQLIRIYSLDNIQRGKGVVITDLNSHSEMSCCSRQACSLTLILKRNFCKSNSFPSFAELWADLIFFRISLLIGPRVFIEFCQGECAPHLGFFASLHPEISFLWTSCRTCGPLPF